MYISMLVGLSVESIKKKCDHRKTYTVLFINVTILLRLHIKRFTRIIMKQLNFQIHYFLS